MDGLVVCIIPSHPMADDDDDDDDDVDVDDLSVLEDIWLHPDNESDNETWE